VFEPVNNVWQDVRMFAYCTDFYCLLRTRCIPSWCWLW